ncbi:MAG: DUF3788 domain-containing protein [Melioribacteraceae bacterium]|nr:DUF3788 domain-containing protein [Melioribacteraceae bacterium]MCF8353607.1 DUF3788 domain-containing protein [Melioribacteraceae bacterium]MCF8393530.1 DUF3788 domain-containing protein [Melioribacteraceae bacterium]MCF8419340.1 DUF3788 domain-containing protein [Melioribacteraceae bacterium]
MENTPKIVFTDKENIPGESDLKETLGKTYSLFSELRDLTAIHNSEWKYYNKKSGWIYKVNGPKKAVCYVSFYEKHFMIGLLVNEKEKEILLNSKVDEIAKDTLNDARKYPEGYALRFNIRLKSNLNIVLSVLKELKRL